MGTLWGGDMGKKVPLRTGRDRDGDGAGITGRGWGIGSLPQTCPIAIPNQKGKSLIITLDIKRKRKITISQHIFTLAIKKEKK